MMRLQALVLSSFQSTFTVIGKLSDSLIPKSASLLISLKSVSLLNLIIRPPQHTQALRSKPIIVASVMYGISFLQETFSKKRNEANMAIKKVDFFIQNILILFVKNQQPCLKIIIIDEQLCLTKLQEYRLPSKRRNAGTLALDSVKCPPVTFLTFTAFKIIHRLPVINRYLVKHFLP